MTSFRRYAFMATLSLVMVLGGCRSSAPTEPTAPTAKKDGLVVTSSAFEDGRPIPAKYTGDGQDLSPPLEWTGVPASAESLVVLCDDPDAPGGTFVHWLLYDIPATEKGLTEGVPRTERLANGAAHGVNDFGRYGYLGPSPPEGPVHHYHFRVYALSKPTGLKPGARRMDLENAMKGKILAQGELVGTYQR